MIHFKDISQQAETLTQTDFGVTTSFKGTRRLSEPTRQLAGRYLAGEFGDQIDVADFAISPEFLETRPTNNRIYAEAVRLIAAKAPLRIIPGEKLVGAATLKEAMRHMTPLTEFQSISHTTIGFEKLLKTGYAGLRREIDEREAEGNLSDEQIDLLRAMRVCLDAAGVWRDRYIDALNEKAQTARGEELKNAQTLMDILQRVPEQPPRTFHEAIQTLWMAWDFQRLCGNWSGVGRFDKMLGPFLRRDLAEGRITLDEARELVAHFWVKGCEWICSEGPVGTGDAQFYQNIVLAGVDENGEPVLNDVTDLVLDVVEELHISDFPIAVRLHSQSPDPLLRRVAAIQRLGGGIVAIYNDDRIIPNLTAFGYPLEDARNYANDGCWEIIIPGKSYFSYQPFDTLQLLQETLGLSKAQEVHRTHKIECFEVHAYLPEPGKTPQFENFESLYNAFREHLKNTVEKLMQWAPGGPEVPCPLISLLVEDCIANAQSYLDRGPTYTVLSPHAGGLPDVANSLLVLKRLVFEKKEFSLEAFIDMLRHDWRDAEPLRRRIQKEFDFYGNDSIDADAMLQRVFNDFTEMVANAPKTKDVLRPAGISTFGRECAAFLSHRMATPAGSRQGDILAANFSATPGTDKRGPTALIRSHCSVDFSRLPCGTALDLKIAPPSVRGETGLAAMTALMRTFIRLGGIFMQMDVVDTELLRDAKAQPEKYPNLSVRISGWSARFATLTETWQDMIISRTEQGCG